MVVKANVITSKAPAAKNVNEVKAVKALQDMFKRTREFKSFFTAAAARKNDMTETSIDTSMTMGNMDRLMAVDLFKQLEAVQIGALVVGRSGHKTRFRWNYSLPVVGQVAKGEKTALVPVSADAEPGEENYMIPRNSPESGPTKGRENVPKVQKATQAVQEIANLTTTLTIPRAKELLAATLGIDPSAIEIAIRQ